MNRLIRGMSYKDTVTENGMPTHSASGDACVDFFGAVAAARNWSDADIHNLFVKALDQDPLIAMRTLFWARDIRGGQGERKVFRACLSLLEHYFQEYFMKNIQLVPEYGRWDDLFHLDSGVVMELISVGLAAEDGLLAKWLPRKGPFANKVRKALGLTPKAYRKLIVGLSNTVEQKMCAREWEGITYEHVPSQAMNKYRKAFARNDADRFSNFIDKVTKGETTIHSDTLFPYQLYQAYKRRENQKVVEAQWANLPNFMEGNENMVLPLCDVSGSMTCRYGGVQHSTTLTPMDISVSLGIYISERNVGPFKDAFLTFSNQPRLQYLKGSFYQRCRQLEKAHWEMNTNLEAAFNMILQTALREHVSPEEMPNTLLIISDMQFDQCVSNPRATANEMIKSKYHQAGYEVPQVVFWNVNARVGQSPVRFNEAGVGLISGCNASILKSVLDGSVLNPRSVMLKTVMAERYQKVTV